MTETETFDYDEATVTKILMALRACSPSRRDDTLIAVAVLFAEAMSSSDNPHLGMSWTWPARTSRPPWTVRTDR